ncbi:MAG: penicillin-binding protein 2 [Candidatus Omnitrophica bacterium]|nr:penicillin-binding protein 2 [Candidatus Omnitrophota bacterium]
MKKEDKARLRYVHVIFLFFFFALFLRIVYLQVFRKDFLRNLSENQYYRLIPLEGKRGKILDRRGRTLATSLNCYSIFADPHLLKSSSETARLLSAELGIDTDVLVKKFAKKGRFVWLKRKVDLKVKNRVKALNLRGIGFLKEKKRFYPQEELAAAVLGIVDTDNNGLEGLELQYNTYLRGKEGWARLLHDSASREVILSPHIISPQSGGDLALTIDAQIQYWCETYLKETIIDFRAEAGSVIVVDASNGDVLALSNYPTFNPNQRETITKDNLRNRAVSDVFEPGSVFKIVTLLAAIDRESFKDDDVIFCENGEMKIPGSTLHDWKPYGDLTFREVFKKSSNIGIGKIANRVGMDDLYDYIEKLGFGKKTGIDFPGEVKGLLKPLSRWSKTSAYIIPIGQEIGTNLVQLSRAFAVIANGGYLIRPRITQNISFLASNKKILIDRIRVVPASVAEHARSVLIEVVEDGTGKRAKINNVTIGGKTGTAQKYDPEIGRYSHNKYRASFVGFIMLDSPLVMAVTIDEPKKHHFGGVIAAPLFRKIAEKTVKYLSGEKTLIYEDQL